MLNVFQKEGVTDVVCVVTRYFGGVLLGAGGLCRAYTKSAKDALDAAGISVVRRWTEVKIPCPYNLFAQVSQEVESTGGVVTDTEYAAHVTLTALLPEGTETAFQTCLSDLSAGSIAAQVTGEALRAVPTSER
jgi:putative IMPACT (imprinted ancient) family translation regulator